MLTMTKAGCMYEASQPSGYVLDSAVGAALTRCAMLHPSDHYRNRPELGWSVVTCLDAGIHWPFYKRITHFYSSAVYFQMNDSS